MSGATVDIIGRVLDLAVLERERNRGDLYSGLAKLDPFEIHAVIKAVEQAVRAQAEDSQRPSRAHQ